MCSDFIIDPSMKGCHCFFFFFFKGHCHGDFAACWSKLLQYLIKNLSSLTHEIVLGAPGGKYGTISPNESSFQQFFQNMQEELEKKWPFFFPFSIHFYPTHSQQNMNDASFCALVRLLLTKLNHYCNVSIHANMFFVYSKWYQN